MVVFATILIVVAAGPTPVTGVGTALPQLLPSSPYRVFNDLMKQSATFVPYKTNNYNWIPGWQWNQNLTLGNDLYPSSLETSIYAEADIVLFTGID